MWPPTSARDRRPGAYGFWDDFERAIKEARLSLQEGASATYQLFASESWFGFSHYSYADGPTGYSNRGIDFGSAFGIPTFELHEVLNSPFGHSVVPAAQSFLQEIVEQIKKAASWEPLAAIARPIIGQYSFAAGILVGLGESLGKDVSSLLGLAKIVVLAGLYERIKHPSLLSFSDPLTLTLALATYRFPTLRREAQKADDLLWKTLEELKKIAKHPIKFIEIVGQNAWKGVQKDWNELKYYAANPSIGNDFQAGRIMGRALYQIIMMILLVISVAGVAVKLAARFPWLMRLAQIISRGGKLEELEEAEQGIRGAREGEDAAKVRAPAREKPKPSGTLPQAMKYPNGIPPEEGARLTQAARSSLGIQGRNVAVAEVGIDGESEMLTSVSGKASPPGTVPAPTDRVFTTRDSGAMTRAHDSEVKIIEDVANGLPPDAQGTISLYTERAPCLSCQGVIQQFQQKFPGINVIVTNGQ